MRATPIAAMTAAGHSRSALISRACRAGPRKRVPGRDGRGRGLEIRIEVLRSAPLVFSRYKVPPNYTL